MIGRRRAVVLLLTVVMALTVTSAAWAAYWFFQGNLSGTVVKARESTGTQYGRQSFDNTNHPGHVQYLVFILSSGSWDTIGQQCFGGSGCDSGSIAVSGAAYPKGGCENPARYGYAVWTNCRYGTGP